MHKSDTVDQSKFMAVLCKHQMQQSFQMDDSRLCNTKQALPVVSYYALCLNDAFGYEPAQ